MLLNGHSGLVVGKITIFSVHLCPGSTRVGATSENFKYWLESTCTLRGLIMASALLFILLHHLHTNNLTIYLDTGAGKHRRLIDVSTFVESLGSLYCTTLLGYYQTLITISMKSQLYVRDYLYPRTAKGLVMQRSLAWRGSGRYCTCKHRA